MCEQIATGKKVYMYYCIYCCCSSAILRYRQEEYVILHILLLVLRGAAAFVPHITSFKGEGGRVKNVKVQGSRSKMATRDTRAQRESRYELH